MSKKIDIKEILKENGILEKDLKEIKELKDEAYKNKKKYDILEGELSMKSIDKETLKVLKGQKNLINSLVELISKIEKVQGKSTTNTAKLANLVQKNTLGVAVLTQRIETIEDTLNDKKGEK